MEQLGYDRFGAVGGDFGAAITTYLALRHPDHLTGILLTTPDEPGSRAEQPAPV